MMPEPFTIQVPQETLDDLRQRLARTRWPDDVADVAWADGTDLAYLRELISYWRSGFDWRAQETRINAFAHFRADIDGFGLHFIHQRGVGPNPLPLILTHGWPSTFYEMHKIIPLLTDPARHGGDPADAFDVVVPSLPGYGFSDRPRQPGFGRHIPALWVRLMNGLGYPRFATHGVDIGAYVTNRLGLEHADRLLGLHVTQLAEPNLGPGTPPLTDRERAFLTARARDGEDGGGYSHIQRTRPQTLAYGLNDSPAGLAGWIIEKWRAWSDCGDDIERRFTKDDLLTTITIYWATETIGSSVRLYRDWQMSANHAPYTPPIALTGPPGADSSPPLPPGRRIEAPAAVALFLPAGSAEPPREWLERIYADLRRVSHPTSGGHFPAMEEPDRLVEDLRTFFRPLR